MKAEDTGVETWCPVCGSAVPEKILHQCMICRRLFCRRCAVEGYGRLFCSTRCRDYFFYGDGEETGEAT